MKKYLLIYLLGIGTFGCNPKEKTVQENAIARQDSSANVNGNQEQETDSIIAHNIIREDDVIDEQDSSTDLTDTQEAKIDTVETENGELLVERFFPETKEAEQFDTLIQDLEISIIQRPLDSYVINEFESGGIRHVDKYRDYENQLIIKKEGEILINKVFKKEDFSDFNDQSFLDVATFHRYWFRKITDNTIELFGSISKPETDWSYAFYHYIDLSTLEITLKEHVDERI